MHLAVSQATALDVADYAVAERLNDSPINGPHPVVSSPENDTTNACVFLDLAICSSLLSSNDRSFEWTDLKTIAEEIVTNFPFAINDLRDIGEKY